MKNILAFFAMITWTISAGAGLYFSGILAQHTAIGWSLIAALILLAIHIGNLILYFKIAGNEPYRWRRESEAKSVGA